MKKEAVMSVKNEKPVTKVCVWCVAVVVSVIPVLIIIYFLLTGGSE